MLRRVENNVLLGFSSERLLVVYQFVMDLGVIICWYPRVSEILNLSVNRIGRESSVNLRSFFVVNRGLKFTRDPVIFRDRLEVLLKLRPLVER